MVKKRELSPEEEIKALEENDFKLRGKDKKKLLVHRIAIAERAETLGTKNNDPLMYKKAADYYGNAAIFLDTNYANGKYTDLEEASKLHARASKLYRKAEELFKEDGKPELEWSERGIGSVVNYHTKLGEVEKNAKREWSLAKRDRINARIYKKTERMNYVRRTLIRKLNLRHMFSIFILLIASLIPTVTGFAIQSDSNQTMPFLPLVPLILFLFLGYFYIQQHLLSK